MAFFFNLNTSFENDIKEGKMKETILKEHQKKKNHNNGLFLKLSKDIPMSLIMMYRSLPS